MKNSWDKVIVVVVIPGLAHLAVPAVNLLADDVPVLIIDNGLEGAERRWLRSAVGKRPILRLRTSGLFGRQMVASHGAVLAMFACLASTGTVFMDADCYLLSPTLMTRIMSGMDTCFLVTPFWFSNPALDLKVADTFLFGVNTPHLKALQRKLSVSFGTSESLPPALALLAEKRWGRPMPWPHPWKHYFDTLHSVIIAGVVQELQTHFLSTQPGDVYHVCGTSYNQANFQAPEAPDVFILNAHYFHLVMVESWNLPWLTSAFEPMSRHYGGAAGLIERHPDYGASTERAKTDELIKVLVVRGAIVLGTAKSRRSLIRVHGTSLA